MSTISVTVNETWYEFHEPISLQTIKNSVCPQADVFIINGFPVSVEESVQHNDNIIMFCKAQPPAKEQYRTFLYARHTPGVQKTLENAVVGIAGLGGLGSNAAIALARSGIGKLIIADFDIVEPSNLNRQYYFIEHLGIKKTEALTQIIHRIDPFISVVSHDIILSTENMYETFSPCDVIIEAFDTVEMKSVIKEVFETSFKNSYLIMASGIAGYYSSLSLNIEKIATNIYVVGDFIHEAKKGDGLMSPRVNIAASMQANTAIRLLLEKYDP